MVLRRVFAGALIVAAAALALTAAAAKDSDRAAAEWRFYAGDNAARKYSPLDQINPANV